MYTNLWGRRVATAVLATVLLSIPTAPGFTRTAAAQEKADPEQLKKAYDDALAQLKAAQDRKNQLAAENEKLAAEVANLKKQLDATHGELDRLRRADAESADKTFFLRSHYAAWQAFIRRYPELYGKWKVFFESGLMFPPRDLPEGIGPDWPPPEPRDADF